MNLMRLAAIAGIVLLAGCRPSTKEQLYYDQGERATVGSLTYTVIESAWRTQLGEMFNIRVPQQRFLMLTVSVTNGGGSEVSIPLLELVAPKGQKYKEISDGTGVSNWLGLIRTLAPAQTVQGRILFDVPLSGYRLRVPDGGQSEFEKFALIDVPLRMDVDQVQSQMPTTIDMGNSK